MMLLPVKAWIWHNKLVVNNCKYGNPELLLGGSNYLDGTILRSRCIFTRKISLIFEKYMQSKLWNKQASDAGRMIVCWRCRINSGGTSAYSLKCPLQFEQLLIWSRKPRLLPGSLSQHLLSERGFSTCPSPDFVSSLAESSEVGANHSTLPWKRLSMAQWVSDCLVVIKPSPFVLQHTCNKHQYRSVITQDQGLWWV